MKFCQKLCIWVVMLIGLVHMVFGMFTYDTFSAKFLWFEGSGLAMIFSSVLNLVFHRNMADVFIYRMAQMVSCLLWVFVTAINWVILMVPGILGWLALVGMLWTNASLHRKLRHAAS